MLRFPLWFCIGFAIGCCLVGNFTGAALAGIAAAAIATYCVICK